MVPGVESASNSNEHHKYFLGGKGGQCIELTILLTSCDGCLEISEPQTPGTLSASPGIALPLPLHIKIEIIPISILYGSPWVRTQAALLQYLS